MFLRKFSEVEYSLYQANINRIAEKNEAVYTPQIKALEDERKSVIAHGCPAQVAGTAKYQPRFWTVLTNINELNRQIGIGPTKKVQSLHDRFIGDTTSQTVPEPVPFASQTLHAHLKAHTTDLNNLEKEYREAFKAAADSEWVSEVKAEYKEKIDEVKEKLADKNAEDIRQWIQNNVNQPIFMAIADRIGYDSTGRKDPINDLDMICDEYRRFSDEPPDFFG